MESMCADRSICNSLHSKIVKGRRLRQDECEALLDMLDVARDKGFEK